MAALCAAAESSVPQAPLELTAANLACVIDPLMAEWIGKRKRPGGLGAVPPR